MNAFLENLFSLNSRVALVTGASSGIGAAIAGGLAGAGARVALASRNRQKGEAVAAGIVADGGEAEYFTLDISKTDTLEPLAQAIHNRFGRLDILVNAAGVTLPQTEEDTLARRIKVYDETMDVNLRAAYAMSLAAGAQMAATGGGSIINITSVGASYGFPGNPGYVAAKGGLRMLGKALAMDLIKDNIRVNAIAPGYIKTAMTAISQADPDLYAARMRHMIVQRWGEPEDMIGAAIFLASDASSYVTGQDINVDGGWTAKGLT